MGNNCRSDIGVLALITIPMLLLYAGVKIIGGMASKI